MRAGERWRRAGQRQKGGSGDGGEKVRGRRERVARQQPGYCHLSAAPRETHTRGNGERGEMARGKGERDKGQRIAGEKTQ